jgi:fibronectin-binding autotransporter adhesin
MNHFNRVIISTVAATGVFLGVQTSRADSATWANNANGNWSVGENWIGGVPAEGAGATAEIPYNVMVTLAGVSQTIGSLTIGQATGNSSLRSSGGATLTMDNDGQQAEIAVGTTAAASGNWINVPIFMTDGGLKISTLGVGAIFSGPISSIAVSGTQTLTLAHNGGGNNFTVGGDISDGNIGGTVRIVIDRNTGATGTINLNGANSFTGGILVRRGSLTATLTGFGDNEIVMGDASTNTDISLGFAGAGVYANKITVDGSGTGDVNLGANGIDPELAGEINLGRNATLVANNGAHLTVSGEISGAGKLNVLNNTAGSSTVTLTGNNSFSGGFDVADGQMRVNLGHAGAVGTGIFGIGHASQNAAFDIRIDNVSGADMTLANNNALRIANFTYVGSHNLNMGTGAVSVGPNSAIMTVLSNTLTIGGVISGHKNVGNGGAGTFVLGNANTYTGVTYVGGHMVVGSIANGGAASSIGAANTGAGNLVLNRGTLDYTGGGATTDRLFTVGNGGGTIASNGTGSLVFENTGDIVSTDTVSLNLAAASFGAGSTIINVGPSTSSNTTGNLAVGQTITGANIAPGTVITEVLDGSRIAISQATTGAATASVYTFGAQDRTLTLKGSNAGNNTIAGALADSASTKLGVTKAGSGKWILSGANTYSGATTVSEGTLVLATAGNNNVANSSHIKVEAGANLDVTEVGSGFTLASGQTLEGNGNVLGNFAVGANSTLSPGNSPGALNHVGTQSWLDGGNYNWQIYDATGLAGVGYDTVIITGALDLTGLTGGDDFNINLWSLSSIAPDANGDAINFDALTSQSWTLVSASAGILGFDESNFAINIGAFNGTGGFANPAFGAFALEVVGNDLVLSYSVIPEPGSVALLLSGVGMFLLLNRRGRRA